MNRCEARRLDQLDRRLQATQNWRCCVFLLGLGLNGAVTAQTAGDELTEIIVTAERRVATVQNTPISMTAISGAERSAAEPQP